MARVVPPVTVKLWFCPVCGKQVKGNYSIDETRSVCTQTIHLQPVVGAFYSREPKEAHAPEKR